MHLYKAAWQRLAPLAARGALLRVAPVRRMSSTSVPGSTGEYLPYYLLIGVLTAGTGVYVYRHLAQDRERCRERQEYIDDRIKGFGPIPKDGSGLEAATSDETEEAAESVTLEAVATTVQDVEEEAITSVSLEPEQPVTEEQEPVPSAEEVITASSVASPLQVEENIEAAEDVTVEPSSPVLEEIAESIQEELASAAGDWSELSARRPEEAVEETSPATEESDEVAETEKVAASS